MSNKPLLSIRFSDEFEKSLFALSKKYRQAGADVKQIINQLEAGNFIGDRLSGLGADTIVMKVRVKNSNIQKGKSGGYRLIYQIVSPTSLILLTIYSKSDQEDISNNEILDILANFE